MCNEGWPGDGCDESEQVVRLIEDFGGGRVGCDECLGRMLR